MKKTFLIISLSILSITAVHSQKRIQFGVKGGINFTSMTSDFLFDKDYKIGFHIGVVSEIPIGDKFALQPEILYATQGTKGKEILYYIPYPGAPSTPPPSVTYELNYLKIPVLAKIQIVKSLSLEIGPSFNFLIKGKETFATTSIKDVGKSFEFSGVVGVSYKLKGGVFGALRYVYGFTPALNWDHYDDTPKNSGFKLGLGYMF